MQPKFLIAGILLLLSVISFSQTAYNPWSTVTASDIEVIGDPLFRPAKYRSVRLDVEGAKHFLWSAPHEGDVKVRESNAVLTLPMPDGTLQDFHIVSYDMMEPGLAARYPEIRTFYGVCATRGYGKVYLDWTAFGLRASFSTPHGKVYIDPQYQGNRKDYFCYFKQDYPQPNEPFLCGVGDEVSKKILSQAGGPEVKAGDCVFRTYRLAIAVTGEFSNFFGSNAGNPDPAPVLSAVITTINRVNQVYEKDFTIRLVLITNTDDLFNYDPATDPYTNSSPGAMLTENQSNTNGIIGIGNYDIGHVFGTQGGGLASLNGPCNNNKASAMTGISNPVGDGFAIDYVAHEMGHQFGATHTQNNDCNRSGNSSMEPGSASTIMGYAGICPPNVQSNSDDYFHAISIQQVANFVAGETCNGTIDTFANNAPAIDPLLNRFIPAGTPFVLTAFGNDADGDALTYCWEQFDPEVGAVMPPSPTNTQGPMFRSLPPTDSAKRYFPRLNDLVTNIAPTWEVLPEVARTMKFRVTARDGDNTQTGCTGESNMTITVDDEAGPFLVTSPDTNVVWYEGQYELVTWDVADTDRGAVACDSVDILLSYDGGLTYPVTLATRIANNGIAYVLVPEDTSTMARVMVRCSDNIFFDISNQNFTIKAGEMPDFGLGATPVEILTCIGGPGVPDPEFVIHTSAYNGFAEAITLVVTNDPALGVLLPSSPIVQAGESALLPVPLALVPAGTYLINVKATSLTTGFKFITLKLIVLDGPEAPAIDYPADDLTDASVQPSFSWQLGPYTNSYRIEISTDSTFQDMGLVFSDETTSFLYQKIADLDPNTTYYWRVRGTDDCTIGDWSAVRSFTTATCVTLTSMDTLEISNMGIDTVNSVINVGVSGFLVDVNVVNLSGTHSWINDLVFSLFSPDTTEVVLFDQLCDNENDFNLGADDFGNSGLPPCPPTNGLSYQPEGSLTAFINKQIMGDWTLRVRDVFDNDGGTLDTWGLRICYSPTPVLPIELMRFAAEPLTSAIRLTWSTGSEVNNAGFELLRRSASEKEFRRIAWVNSRGDSQAETHYYFDDKDVRPGVRYYYQLNQVDFDGKPSLSDVVSAELKGRGQWQVSPNPVSGGLLRLKYEGTDREDRAGVLRVFNAQGMLVREMRISGSAIELETDDLPAGVYLLTVDDQNGRQTETIIRS